MEENVKHIFKEKIKHFNRSDIRKKLEPMELASGWPCIKNVNEKLCIVIPYFRKTVSGNGYDLYPIYCSVTILYNNPNRVLDFTVYSTLSEWSRVDYSKPVGRFKHKALEDVKTRDEYIDLCDELYSYYDKMAEAVLNKRPFSEESDMIELFSKLMEPSLYPFYKAINPKFYSNFYKSEEN